ncbi:MAG TPA: hypothetical protein VFF03_06135 [Rhodocyclaceae bacterium]|nr:hypothetical protein [Rhodocyclaceae bacterium]
MAYLVETANENHALHANDAEPLGQPDLAHKAGQGRLAPLSYVAPVRELSMLLGVLFGAKLLSESLDPSRVIGTVCMVAGIVMLAHAT